MHRALFAILALPGCVVVADRSMSFDDLQGVVVQFSNGDVIVTGVPDTTTTTVDVDMGGVTFDRIGHNVNDGVLMLALDCGIACGGSVELTLPQDVWVDVQLERGDVEVTDLAADLSATLGAGDITVSGLTGGQIELGTAMGSLDAQLDAAADSLSADVAAGDAVLRVPEGGYNLDLDAGVGSVDTDGVWHEPSSPYCISASVAAGSLEVWGAPPR